MNRFKKSKYIIVLFVLVLVVSVFLVMTQSSAIVTKAGDGISLVDRIVQKPFQWLSSAKSDLGHLTRAYNENESLKKELYQMKKETNEADRLKEENEQLRQLLEMKSKLNGTKVIASDVIMRTPSTWKQELTVDAGSSQGVTSNMLVVAGGGLIGSVEKVEDNSSVVNLLTNAENTEKISVKIQHGSTSVYGIIIGYDKEKDLLKISQLNSSSDISKGDKVVTGGLGNFNATDIPVGEVESVTHSNDYLTREVLVKLQSDSMNTKVVELVGEPVMRLFKQVGMFLLLPLIILIDSHLGQFVNSFFPYFQLVSHSIFIFLLFETIEVSEYLFLAYCLIIGLIYDIYFFHLIGIASLLFVIIGAIIYKNNSIILSNRWTRLLAILMMTFLFEFGSFILAQAVGLTAASIPVFIVYSLVPSMILNGLWMIVFQFIFEKIYL